MEVVLGFLFFCFGYIQVYYDILLSFKSDLGRFRRGAGIVQVIFFLGLGIYFIFEFYGCFVCNVRRRQQKIFEIFKLCFQERGLQRIIGYFVLFVLRFLGIQFRFVFLSEFREKGQESFLGFEILVVWDLFMFLVRGTVGVQGWGQYIYQ